MKQSRLYGNWVIMLFAFIGLLAFTACEQNLGEDNPMMYTISGNASGSQVVPAGTGTGTITGTYNQSTNLLTYTINWNGLNGAAQSGSLYIGMPGSVNSTSHQLSTGTVTSTANSYTGQIRLSREEERQLFNGNLYYVVTSAVTNRPGIGGKITAVRR